ncbi:hypothetical protein E2C01_033346 [Portunus trituberculatus]|uniref:Uncharacterized protein n=1 Tax=Portunus trituberculatus TaxID=210409 RepID=A0A5B7F2Q5_PORTR|nr:hypothetical protein [Portunus trituberculatus]
MQTSRRSERTSSRKSGRVAARTTLTKGRRRRGEQRRDLWTANDRERTCLYGQRQERLGKSIYQSPSPQHRGAKGRSVRACS